MIRNIFIPIWLCLTVDLSVTLLQNPKIVYTQLLFRHGARNPMVNLMDSNCDPKTAVCGFSMHGEPQELTREGRVQGYNLGKWLAIKYEDLIRHPYRSDRYYVKSSDVDRTLMTTECVLAGMLPPQDSEVWNDDLNWQPVPIHTVPIHSDNQLAFLKPCSKLKSTFSEEIIMERTKKLIGSRDTSALESYLKEHTGFSSMNIYTWLIIVDYVSTLRANGHPLPTWVTSEVEEIVRTTATLALQTPLDSTSLRLLGGALLHEIIENILEKVASLEGRTESSRMRTMTLFGGHDITIIILMKVLGVWDNSYAHITYTAVLMMDLIRDNGAYTILLSIKQLDKEPVELKIPGCERFCDVEEFIRILEPFNIDNEAWERECQL